MASLVFPLPSDAGERLQRWVFYMGNLWVDANITTLQGVLTRAAEAGYTHALLSDSKFARLGGMDSHYFANVAKIKSTAAALGIEIVPAVFPIGYSNDILFHDPNLIEALPVKNALLVVSNGFALAQADSPVAFLNLVRRPGAPLVIQRENGTNLVEGADYPVFKDPLMGVKPWNGSYDVYHAAPLLPSTLPNGTRLRASWYHAVFCRSRPSAGHCRVL